MQCFVASLFSFENVRKSWDNCDSSFFVTLCFSFCLEPRRSAENDSQCCEVPGFLKLCWSSKQFPKVVIEFIWLSVIIWKDFTILVGKSIISFASPFFQFHPVLSDLEHLRDKHLLLSVKSCDGFESYGKWSSSLCLFKWNSSETVVCFF